MSEVLHSLLPWLRRGLAATIRDQDNPTRRASVTIPVEFRVGQDLVGANIRLVGPGDITAILAEQVVRVDPRPLSSDFEPNYFVSIDLHEPDFPWMFTPLGTNGRQQLAPWLCLIVIPKQSATYVQGTQGKLPTITVDDPARQLPDLGEVWAWAHSQVTWAFDPSGDRDTQLDQTIDSRPGQSVTRLICPRRLDPTSAYRACVVPAFLAGVQAGLGNTVIATDLAPAWDRHSAGPVTLPVYYSWEFSTAEAGDFLSLLRPLWEHPQSQLVGVGTQPMDASDPGYGLDAGVMQFEGAICVPPCDRGPDPSAGFQSGLQPILERSVQDTPDPPTLGSPIYGRWYTGRTAVPDPGAEPIWFRELNLDPRYRAAAGLGATVVHHQQEQLMAAAWDHVARVRETNRVLGQLQLAREAASAVHQAHVLPLADDHLWQFTERAHGRILVGRSGRTVTAAVRSSDLPSGALAPTLRRVARPRGPVVRRLVLTQPGLSTWRAPMSLVRGLNQGTLEVAPRRGKPAGTIGMADVANSPPYTRADAVAVANAPGWAAPDVRPAVRVRARARVRPEGDDGQVQWETDTDAGIPRPPLIDRRYFRQMKDSFRAAAALKQAYLVYVAQTLAPPSPAAVPLQLDRQGLLDAVQPAKTIEAIAHQRLDVEPEVWQRPDPLDALTVSPQFTYAMYEPLRNLAPDLVLPGIGTIPPNTISLLESNSRFLEAYMVGLNHSMASLLRWRDFPVYPTATYFQRFWPSANPNAEPDIQPIQSWDGSHRLGGNTASPPLVLLARNPVFRRYPTASVAAVKAVMRAGSRVPGGQARPARFTARFDPDIVLFAFDLSVEEARGDADGLGWFIRIEQHIVEPRFGLEPAQDADFGHDPTDWRSFSWGNLVNSAADLEGLVYASTTHPAAVAGSPLRWDGGSDAAQIASIALRPPVSVAIHASALLPARN